MLPDILTPISSAKPCGEDVKYDDAYIAVENLIDKSKSVNAHSEIDWSFVASECETLLSARTKDVKIACHLTLAKFMIGKNDGLKDGLETLKALLDTFGANLFPTSLRAKINAFAWLEEELNALLCKGGVVSLPFEQHETFLALFTGLQGNIKNVCGDENFFFSEICRTLQTSKTQRETAPQTPVTPKASVAATLEIGSEADETAALNLIKKQAAALLSYWRGQKIDDLRAIRLTRAIAWLEIDELPIAKDGATAINPPNAETVDRIDAFIDEGKNKEAFNALEELIIKAPFWFEGHLKAYKIMETLGADSACAMIKGWVKGFIKAFDDIILTSFKGGAPFVSSSVKSWLNDNERAEVVEREELPANRLETARTDCFRMARSKKIREAIELIRSYCKNAASKEEEFEWKTLRVEILLEVGKTEIALALIDELKKEIQVYRLEEWRPDLVERLYALLLKSPKRAQIGRDQLELAYSAICRLNVAEALNIKPT